MTLVVDKKLKEFVIVHIDITEVIDNGVEKSSRWEVTSIAGAQILVGVREVQIPDPLQLTLLYTVVVAPFPVHPYCTEP